MGADLAISHVRLETNTNGAGLYEITDRLSSLLHAHKRKDGLLHLFLHHTSASLVIQENADPSAKYDLERFLHKLVPAVMQDFTHTLEGPDDMPAHIKAALTQSSLTIPVFDGTLGLGTWQGVYLWEHREGKHRRTTTATLQLNGDS